MKNIRIKNLLSVCITCVILTTSLYGCGNSANATQPSKSDEKKLFEVEAYGVVDPQISAQQIIADKKGFFEEEGLKVTNKLLQSGGDISPLISGGSAKVSFESTYTDIALAANNVDVKMLATMANIGDTQCVVAGKNVTINSAKDIEGKKIGIASGAGVLIAIRNMCKDLGVDINKIQFVILAPSDQISALERGDIDMMACWEPWVSNAINAGGKLLFSGLNSYLPEKNGSVNWLNFHTTVQVTGDFLKNNPKQVESLLKALSKATDYINKNPEESAKIIAPVINLDEKQVLNIMKKNVYTMKFDKSFVDSTNEMASFMHEMGNINSVPKFESFGDSTPLKNAVPELVSVN
jgi:ABC-type nitrate/sulfonate/bicarbonate transport systems, periplasmic components